MPRQESNLRTRFRKSAAPNWISPDRCSAPKCVGYPATGSSLPHRLFCKVDERLRVLQHRVEVFAAHTLNPVVRLVLYRQEAAKRFRRLIASWLDLSQQQFSVRVALAARSSAKDDAAGRVRCGDASENPERGGSVSRGRLLAFGRHYVRKLEKLLRLRKPCFGVPPIARGCPYRLPHSVSGGGGAQSRWVPQAQLSPSRVRRLVGAALV